MRYKTDILIIGTGGAGLRAAIEAADNNTKVILVGKTLLGKAHTVMAEGGINAALGNVDPQDNWEIHFKDTMEEGHLINDWRMVEIMTKEAPKAIMELENYGALFDRTPEGKIIQRAFGGHSYKRTCHIGDRTGLEIMQVLMQEVMRRQNKIENIEEIIITKLVKNKKKEIIGVLGISLRTGEIIVIECKAIIMAAGGLARVYRRSTNAWENVGDGCALALDAGAELQDMEMIQFHPTGMAYPKTSEGVLVTESVRGEGGILLNAQGERFMSKYDPQKMELSTRDVVSRAIFTEIMEGRKTEHNGVWLDISHKPKKFIEKKLPKMISKFKDLADVDITKQKMEVAPTAHYSMGGIKVDAETGASKVKGLFAAGEITTGVHGANRLGGNSLIDILIFGKITGKNTAVYAKSKNLESIPEELVKQEQKRLTIPFEQNGVKPVVLKKRIQEVMWENVGIMRNEKGLTKALEEIKKIKTELKNVSITGSKEYNHTWIQYLDLLAMLPTCEAIIESALFREESRGAHFRTDYPSKNNEWLKNIVVKSEKGKLSLNTIVVSKIPEKLAGFLK